MKHTKGNWRVTNGEPYVMAGEKTICKISNEVEQEEDFSEIQANAILISKAPEMYEALKSAYQCSGERGHLTKPVLDVIKNILDYLEG